MSIGAAGRTREVRYVAPGGGYVASVTHTDDVGLVELAQGGDESAFELLVGSYERMIHSTARRYVRNTDDAEDVVQDALVLAFTRLDQLRNPDRFGSWLGTIVRNKALQWQRRNARIAGSIDDNPEILRRYSVGSDRIDRQNGTVREEVHTLPDKYKQAVALHYWGDYSYTEMAEMLDLPLSTVQGRLYQSRSKLRESITGNDGNADQQWDYGPVRVCDIAIHFETGRIALRLTDPSWERNAVSIRLLTDNEEISRVEYPFFPCWPRFSPDGRSVVFSGASTTSGWAGVFQSLETGETVPVFDRLGYHITHAEWSPDGSRIAFCICPKVEEEAEERDYRLAIWTLDLVTGKTLIQAGDVYREYFELAPVPRWSPSGRMLAYPKLERCGDTVHSSIRLADVREDDGDPEQEMVYHSRQGFALHLAQSCWSPDERCIAAIGFGREMRPGLRVIDTVTHQTVMTYEGSEPLCGGFMPTGTALWVVEGNSLALLSFPDGKILHRHDLLGGKTTGEAVRRGVWRGTNPFIPAPDGKGAYYIGGDSVVYHWNTDSTCRTVATAPERSDSDGPYHEQEDYRFVTSRGRDLLYRRSVPLRPKNMAVLWAGGLAAHNTPSVFRLVSAGYEVVQADWIREPGQWCVTDVRDLIECALHWKEHYGVGKSIAVGGLQHGGMLALLAAAQEDNPFECCIALSALTKIWRVNQRMALPQELSEEERIRVLRERSPVCHADHIRVPVLILHARHDASPLADMERIQNTLEQNGVRCDLKVFEKDSHGLRLHTAETLRSMTEFLDSCE